MSDVIPGSPVEPEQQKLPQVEQSAPGQRYMRAPQLMSISSFWFATNVHWTALLVLLLPAQVAAISGSRQASDLGKLMGIGALMSLVVPLVVGPLSDRCTSRLGRRRPYLYAGVAVNLIGLFLLFYFGQHKDYWGFVFGFCIVQLGNNIATGAYNGVIPDAVLPSQRGVASGYMGLMSQLGSAVGAVVAGQVFKLAVLPSYTFMAACLVLFAILTGIGLKEIPLTKKVDRMDWAQFFKSLWIDPRKYPDFAWVWITRALVMLGFYTVQPFVLYYLRDVIKVPDPGAEAGKMLLLILVGATISGLVGGWLSDRVGRKVIVYGASAIMAAMAIALPFCRSLVEAMAVGATFGLGYGAYISVDWALGTDVLPNKEDAGKDMAVWHISMVLPQSIAPAIAGFLLEAFGSHQEVVGGSEITHYTTTGYQVIFLVSAGFLVLGAVLLRNVKKVR
jgi:MFS family permease